MGIAEIPVATGQHDKEGKQLSVAFGNARSGSSHSRSVSVASSDRTVVGRNPNLEPSSIVFKRRHTQVAVVELSWWDCFKGFLFGPKGLKQKLAATVEVAEMEDADIDMFDHKKSPFIVTVAVYANPSADVKQRQEARCLLDTGCMQGNIISASLAHRLGFTTYEALKPREESGGTVATGHIHQVLGAIHLTWYQVSSAKIFNNMRFLVSESDQFDLVIGTHSISRFRLFSPPNLGVGMKQPSDPEREKLALQEANLKTLLEDSKEGSKGHKRRLKEHKAAEIRLRLHDAEISLKRSNTEKTQKATKLLVDGLKVELQKYTGR